MKIESGVALRDEGLQYYIEGVQYYTAYCYAKGFIRIREIIEIYHKICANVILFLISAKFICTMFSIRFIKIIQCRLQKSPSYDATQILHGCNFQHVNRGQFEEPNRSTSTAIKSLIVFLRFRKNNITMRINVR